MGPDPSLAGFIVFIQTVMGISSTYLLTTNPIISVVYNLALAIVNEAIGCVPEEGIQDPTQPTTYCWAVYNLAGDRLLNTAQDIPDVIYKDGLGFFAYTRKAFNLIGFTGGVVQSAGDGPSAASYAVPDALKQLTIRDLQNLKTPYGIAYLEIAQDYGPSEWGLTI